jgi:hypothetical protein
VAVVRERGPCDAFDTDGHDGDAICVGCHVSQTEMMEDDGVLIELRWKLAAYELLSPVLRSSGTIAMYLKRNLFAVIAVAICL